VSLCEAVRLSQGHATCSKIVFDPTVPTNGHIEEVVEEEDFVYFIFCFKPVLHYLTKVNITKLCRLLIATWNSCFIVTLSTVNLQSKDDEGRVTPQTFFYTKFVKSSQVK